MRGLRYMIIVPVLLLMTSVVIGVNNYQKTKEKMSRDLTSALRQLVLNEQSQQLLLDSLHSLSKDMVLTLNEVESRFNSQLSIPSLKDTSHVSICLLRQDEQNPFREKAFVCSDTLLWLSPYYKNGDAVIAVKAYANPSLCSVLGHSDQRLPLTGLLLCLLLFLGMVWKSKKWGDNINMTMISNLSSTKEIHLTPMQEQLMDMFANSPDHTLSKETICSVLWPKKEQPENTLYTFICRLKGTLKEQSDMDIINKRGKVYQLVRKTETTDCQVDKSL